MNKKALEDSDTQEYKMEKEPEIGTAHMGSKIMWVFLLAFLILIVAVVFALLFFR